MASDDPEPIKAVTDEDIAARLRRVREDLDVMALPDLTDDEVNEKVEKIQAKVSDLPELPEFGPALEKWKVRKLHKERSNRLDQASYKGLGVGLSIAYAIVGLPIAGYFAGMAIGHWTSDHRWQAPLTLIGVVGSLWYAIFVLNRANVDK